MPTKKPRITITFPENLKSTIQRFADLQGVSFGAVVVDLLETVHDPLMRTLAILDAAREAPVEVRRGLRQVFDDVERDLVKSAGSGLAQMDWVLERVRQETPAPARSNPRPSNTGVRSRKKGSSARSSSSAGG
jgi:hypothetical protein